MRQTVALVTQTFRACLPGAQIVGKQEGPVNDDHHGGDVSRVDASHQVERLQCLAQV